MVIRFRTKEQGAHMASLSYRPQQATASSAPADTHIGCPQRGCSFVAIASREGLALNVLAQHLVQQHMVQPVGEAS